MFKIKTWRESGYLKRKVMKISEQKWKCKYDINIMVGERLAGLNWPRLLHCCSLRPHLLHCRTWICVFSKNIPIMGRAAFWEPTHKSGTQAVPTWTKWAKHDQELTSPHTEQECELLLFPRVRKVSYISLSTFHTGWARHRNKTGGEGSGPPHGTNFHPT